MLSADPDSAVVGTATQIEITGTLNGGLFDDDDTSVTLVLAPNGTDGATAERDIHFDAALISLSIGPNAVKGTAMIEITPLVHAETAGKIVIVKALKSPRDNADGEAVTVDSVAITLKALPAGEEAAEPGALAFDTDTDLGATVFSYVVGKAIDALELPDVKGGTDDDKSYSVSALPAGLSFDAATQTISGTPTAATEETPVTYTVLDTDKAAVAVVVKIEVKAAPAPTTSVASVSATQTSIRENGETTVISVTATLAEAAPTAGTISFTVGNATDGATPAVRDVDYTALGLGSVAIEAGATQASSTLTLTPINNDETDGNRSFGVHAE